MSGGTLAIRVGQALAGAASVLAVVALLAWRFDLFRLDAGKWKGAADEDAATIAVLPLRELDLGAGAAAPNGEGFAYMIAGELARNPDLHVVSTLVAADLRAKGMSTQEIGSMAGVRFVVDGSVGRHDDRLSLEVQLVDTGNGRIAWTGRFEPTAHDLPGVTQLLAERIGGSLGSTVRELSISASLNRAPTSLDAHALALHGIALAHVHSGESLRQARRILEQATRLDPGYAPAWTHLGLVKTLLIFSGNDTQPGAQGHDQAIADIQRGIALDPALASSWRLLSFAIDSTRHAEQAVEAAQRAVELGPGDPDNWLALGLAQYHARRIDDGLRNVEKAIAWNRGLRPPVYAVVEARLRYAVRDYDSALRSARDCMERAPALAVCKAIWLSSSIRGGHATDAEAAWPKLVAATPRLEKYRYAPGGTPEAGAIDQDLERLRGSTRTAMR